MSVPRNPLTRTLARGPLALVAATVLSLSALTACSSGSGTPDRQTVSAPSSITVDATTTVVDVRTPAEFAQGHLSGAVNIDLAAADFDQQVSALDPDAQLVVYCRSGNRSAVATARMRDLGLDDVIDAGGVDAAAASTGLSITR